MADEPLPVEQAVPELRAALADPGVAVLDAPPGSGKTTVVPLRLLTEPWLGDQRIVVLEPRRLAVRAAARRLAEGLGEDVGATVGYRTRDDARVGPATRIEVVTEGILTRRLQRDAELAGVGLVVFDEVHERNLQTDLGLALALDVRASLRPDLRLLAMSATVEGDRLARLLGGSGRAAPVVRAEGQVHPVEVRWSPRPPRDRLEAAVVAGVRQALAGSEGDVLVFLPGVAEIERARRALDGGVGDARVLPLHGSLPAADQDRALRAEPGRRRVVVATDIAESSLTVAGVHAVVDAGLSRSPAFDPRTGMTRLVTGPASRASAEQRAGRAGRLGPGLVVRLWSKLEHAARPAHTPPEIARVELAGLALELATWGVDEPSALAFLDPPPGPALAEARLLLVELGALGPDGRPTPAGRAMAELPLHPRLARMVVDAATDDSWTACLLAAALEDRDVLGGRPDERPADLGLRVAVLEGSVSHPGADRRAVARARDRARALARRARIEPAGVDHDRVGPLVALAHPDRIAQARGGAGRYRLRTGTGAWLPDTDPLAAAPFVVAADLDGRRGGARIRLGAALEPEDVLAAVGDRVEERRTVAWDRERDDLVERIERTLDALTLGQVDRRPAPGPEATAALLDRVRATRLAALPWSPEAERLRRRVAFLARVTGDDRWPDLTDRALLADLDPWLGPHLVAATGRADLDRLDLVRILRGLVPGGLAADLDRLAPSHLQVGTRRVELDYGEDGPAARVRVRDLYGTSTHPTVAGGRIPVVLHLLSPADRPVQVTADLPGFWAGSWAEVRKEMAGRYPKHPWPDDPATYRGGSTGGRGG